MAKADKDNKSVDESVEVKPHPTDPKPQEGDFPIKGEAKQDYLDINDPKHGNKTYEELQAEA